MSNSSIWHIVRTLSSATTPGLSKPGSDRNERVLYIPQSFSITRVSLLDYLVSYPEYLLERVLPLCKDEVGVFYSPSRLGWCMWVCELKVVFSLSTSLKRRAGQYPEMQCPVARLSFRISFGMMTILHTLHMSNPSLSTLIDEEIHGLVTSFSGTLRIYIY